MRKRPPTHPGAILKRQYMTPLGLTVTELSERIAVSRKTVSKLVNERAAVSVDLALRLSQAFNTSPEMWLNLQRSVDLWHASRGSSGWRGVRRIAM